MKEWILRTVDDLRYGDNEVRKRNAMIVLAGVAFAAAIVIAALNLFSGGNPGKESRKRDLVDSRTGQAYLEFVVPENEKFPYVNPDTGQKTLYPAEKCFWTKDGKAKLKPTYVLLNQYAGKEGETLCPDCGRRVTPHNPAPPPELLSAAAAEGRSGK